MVLFYIPLIIVSGQKKHALLTTFAIDPFVAFDQLMAQGLTLGETVYVFLAELEKLAILIRKLPEQ